MRTDETTRHSRLSIRSHYRTIGVALLAVALFTWLFHGVDVWAVGAQIRRARADLLLLSMVPLAIMYVARALRWQYLLKPLGTVGFATAFRATVIGFAAIGLLPGRVGEVLRPYLLARRQGLDPASVFATIVIERLLDLMMVLLLLAVYVLLLGGRETLPPWLVASVQRAAAIAVVVAAALMAMAWTLAKHPERVARLVLYTDRVLPARVAQGLSRMAQTFSQGFAVAREARPLTLAALWSAPVWVCNAIHAWLITIAFGIAMPPAGGLLLQTLLVIGVAAPTPGGLGGYHAMYRLGVTTFFGASDEAAVGGAIVAHALSFAPVVIVGAIFMMQDGLSFTRLEQLTGREPQDAHQRAAEATS